MSGEVVIDVEHVATQFGEVWVHEDVSFQVLDQEIFGIVGGSGSGKTTLLREILLLQKATRGVIRVLGEEITRPDYGNENILRRRFGVMFQQGALFSSLNVLENIGFPLREFTTLSPSLIQELALLKLSLVGLDRDVGSRFPSELSGGMIKRVAIARALAMDPELLFLDEPTAGLDPNSANGIDDLVLELNASLGVTIVLVTHDLDTLWRVADRIAFLGEGRVLALGPLLEVTSCQHPLVQDYFLGPRGRAATMMAKEAVTEKPV